MFMLRGGVCPSSLLQCIFNHQNIFIYIFQFEAEVWGIKSTKHRDFKHFFTQPSCKIDINNSCFKVSYLIKVDSVFKKAYKNSFSPSHIFQCFDGAFLIETWPLRLLLRSIKPRILYMYGKHTRHLRRLKEYINLFHS